MNKNNLRKEFIPYEQALELKELGFDEPCFFAFDNCSTPMRCTDLRTNEQKFNGVNYNSSSYTSQPTFSQAFRWSREKYNWQHSIEPTADQHSRHLGYNYWIWNYKTREEHYTMPKNRPTGDWEYETYEEAELACLIKLIEIENEQK